MVAGTVPESALGGGGGKGFGMWAIALARLCNGSTATALAVGCCAAACGHRFGAGTATAACLGAGPAKSFGVGTALPPGGAVASIGGTGCVKCSAKSVVGGGGPGGGIFGPSRVPPRAHIECSTASARSKLWRAAGWSSSIPRKPRCTVNRTTPVSRENSRAIRVTSCQFPIPLTCTM